MSAEAAFIRSWHVGSREVTLSAPRDATGAVHAIIEWSPDLPRSLTLDELAEYRTGRNRALADLAAELSISVGVVEL